MKRSYPTPFLFHLPLHPLTSPPLNTIPATSFDHINTKPKKKSRTRTILLPINPPFKPTNHTKTLPNHRAVFEILLYIASMVKKMRLIPSLFKNRAETGEKQNPWQWPSCKHPKTLSFRAGDDIFKTVNSVFFDPAVENNGEETPESWFTNSSECASFSTESEDFDGESLEMVVRGVQSERLFFEPGVTSSILVEAKADHNGQLPFKESVVLAMESEDPYGDFRRSMEEMVQSHGLKDWDRLEELLGWYLKVNGKKNHGFIVGAFVDLLVGLASPPNNACSDSTSFSSAASSLSSSSSPLRSFQDQNHEIYEEEEEEEE